MASSGIRKREAEFVLSQRNFAGYAKNCRSHTNIGVLVDPLNGASDNW